MDSRWRIDKIIIYNSYTEGLHVQVYLRDPSSYTPIRPDLIQPGGPKSLTLGMCGKMNRDNIAQFSQRDAVKYEEYEEQLEQFVKAVDPLLDAAAIDVRHVAFYLEY